MKRKVFKQKAKVGVGPKRVNAVIKDFRKGYGPMLKRLANYE